jgi:cysteine desulfurase
MARALELCQAAAPAEARRIELLRNRLFAGLVEQIPGVHLNGPPLDREGLRLEGNLNLAFDGVDGEALILNMRQLAVSSGSACTSANPEPSHVLRSLGISDDRVRSSLRFGVGRFNTAEEIEFAIAAVATAVRHLRSL